MTRKLLLTTLAIAGAGAAAAQAAVVFYEDFSGSNFVVGGTVQDVASNSTGALGQGTNTWHDRDLTNYSATIRSESLSYSGGSISMTGSGKVIELTASASQSGTFAVGVNLETAVTAGAVGAGNTLYMSTLVRYTGNISSDRAWFAGLTSAITTTGVTGPGAGFANTGPQFSLSPANLGNNLVGSGTNSAADTTYLYVWGLLSDGTNWTSISSWVNPTTATPGTALQTTDITDTNGTIQSIAFLALGLDGGETIRFGDTRVATTWAEAVAVPEPSTYALIGGLATLGLVLWRRRRAA